MLAGSSNRGACQPHVVQVATRSLAGSGIQGAQRGSKDFQTYHCDFVMSGVETSLGLEEIALG